MQLETINKLYLELSQVATAQTNKEASILFQIGEARSAALNLCYEIEKLPACEFQTKLSLLASGLEKRLNGLLP